MTGLYRGPGGTGDAELASSLAPIVAADAAAAEAAKLAAQAAQIAAELAEDNAAISAGNAALSEAAADADRIAAAGSALDASDSASAAASSASDADADRIAAQAAQLAAESARDAAQLAKTNAETAETNAETAETNAVAARDAAQLAYDNFDDRYLGAKASDPTLDNDGNALVTGALYFNSTSSEFRGYNGTSWISLPATTATNVTFSATGNIAATNVQTAIAEVDSEKVAKTGDVMTGDYSITGTLTVDNIIPGTPFSFRNKIINGNFGIWQRGTSSASSATSRYLADRWYNVALTHSIEASRQAFSLGQTDVPNEPTYFHRAICTLGGTGSGYAALLRHSVESVRTLAGKTATVSFYAKADATKPMSVELHQYFGGGGSPSAGVICGVQKVNLTTAWQRFEVTVSVPSIAGKTLGTDGKDALQVNFWFAAGSSFDTRTDTLGSRAGTFDIAQVQIEEGSVATPFEQRPYGLELSLCERYYEVVTYLQMSAYGATDNFFGTVYRWRTRKRADPVVTVGTATFSNASTLTVANQYADSVYFYAKVTATGPAVWVADSVRADAEL